MSFVGTFGSFNTARLGIYAAQKGLSVTGNNIANINTKGYTRQTLDQISLRTNGFDRYRSQYDARVGNGVLATGVSQIRDPYLDIRYRSQMANVGACDAKLAGLEDIASILDEVAKGEDENGVLDAQLSDLFKTLENLANNTGQKEYDTQVRSSAQALVTLFNSYAKRLEEVRENADLSIKQDMESINKILYNIRDLNDSIRKNEIFGDSALEMRDERNRLIDELSQYVKIDVTYSMEDIGAGRQVEKLTIKLANANPDSSLNPNTGTDTDSALLVDGIYATQLSFEPAANPDPNTNAQFPYLDKDGNPTDDIKKAATPGYMVNLDALKDENDQILSEIRSKKETLLAAQPTTPPPADILHPDGSITSTTYREEIDPNGGPSTWYEVVTTSFTSTPIRHLDDNDLYGSLQSSREFLTEEGEFATQNTITNIDEKANGKRGIGYYQKSLDLLANKLAATFNEANNGDLVDEDGNLIGGKPAGAGNLFSNHGNGNDATGITAKNISISADWANGNVQIVNSYVKPKDMDIGSTDNSNILHMVSMMTEKMTYNPQDAYPNAATDYLFKGTFHEMLGNMNTVLGNDRRSTTILMDTCYTASIELDTSRDSISSVDLNDEAANMMQYQKSYAAACRLMTTFDEVLDKLINGTGIAGR